MRFVIVALADENLTRGRGGAAVHGSPMTLSVDTPPRLVIRGDLHDVLVKGLFRRLTRRGGALWLSRNAASRGGQSRHCRDQCLAEETHRQLSTKEFVLISILPFDRDLLILPSEVML